jgi:hypothetical protein
MFILIQVFLFSDTATNLVLPNFCTFFLFGFVISLVGMFSIFTCNLTSFYLVRAFVAGIRVTQQQSRERPKNCTLMMTTTNKLQIVQFLRRGVRRKFLKLKNL